MKDSRIIFDTSVEVTKKKNNSDINAEPEMVELKHMIRSGALCANISETLPTQ